MDFALILLSFVCKYLIMRISKNLIITFTLLIIVASLYRVMPGRPWGFTPQIAMAIFGGAVIKDKRLAFLLPLLSMFISDALYELLFRNGIGSIPGFYEGQVTNYILFASMTVFGFLIKGINITKIIGVSVIAPTTFFFISNFFVWASNSPDAGLQRPKTFNGLLLCYQDALPFYYWTVPACLIFSALLFGGYYLFMKKRSLAYIIN